MGDLVIHQSQIVPSDAPVIDAEIVDSLVDCPVDDHQHPVIDGYMECCCGESHDPEYCCDCGHYHGTRGACLQSPCGDYRCCIS